MLQEAKEREYLFRGKKESSKETSKSLFVTVMDFLAFPEEHMSCPTIHNMDGRDEVEDMCTRPSHEGSSLESKNCDQGVDNSTFQEKHQSGPSVEMPALPLRSEEDMDSRDQPEKITFERVMDVIAFPEKHLPCPSLEAFKAPYLMGKSEVSKNISEKKSLEIAFERFMTAMAFPKKQLAFHMCPTSNTAQRENSEEGSRVETKDCSEENMFDSVLNPLAFPEKYLEKMMEFAAVRNYNEDDVAETEDVAKHYKSDRQASLNVQRNDCLIDSCDSLKTDDFQIVRGEQKELMVPNENFLNNHYKDVLDIICDLENESFKRNIEYRGIQTKLDTSHPCSVNRSLISEASVSTVEVPLESTVEAPLDRDIKPRNEGMKLLLQRKVMQSAKARCSHLLSRLVRGPRGPRPSSGFTSERARKAWNSNKGPCVVSNDESDKPSRSHIQPISTKASF